MGQMLSSFEELIEPHVPAAKAQAFKAIVRTRLNRFENDIGELLDMLDKGQIPNAHAQDLRDRLPDGAQRGNR